MFKKYNFLLIIWPLIIFSLGFITLLSTSPDFIKDHVIYFIIGYLLYFIVALNDYNLLKYIWKYLYIISIILLVITFLFAELKFGAARWINFGPFTLQPSELAKLALIISLSSLLSDQQGEIKIKNIINYLALFLPILVLIFVQPDLGTTIVIFGIFAGLLFFVGIKKIYIIIFLLVSGLFSSPIWHSLKDYQQTRILVFLNPKIDVLGSGYNVIQSLIAIGSGGIMGKGFGMGTQSNLNFLPAYWTDFIFASFAEEWGFLGVCLLLTFYLFLLCSILIVAFRSNDLFGRFVSIGVFLMIFTQFVINIGMNLGIMPVTGVTLPLMSYGGSSLIITMVSLGLVHSVWLRTNS